MESYNPQYFYPPPHSYSNVSFTQHPVADFQSESQVQRWANWIKFVSCFTIASSTINLFRLTVELISLNGSNKISEDSLTQFMLICLLHIGIGILGYRLSNKKTSLSARNFIIAYILLIIVSTIIFISAFYQLIMNACHEGHELEESVNCDEDEAFKIALITGAIFCFVSVCFSLPIILCACKLKKFTKGVEENRRVTQVPQNVQMMNYFSGATS